MEQKLQYIDVVKIWPHQDNPRKELGDLSELAESIKKNGVMQNLTVVKRYGEITGEWVGSYTVIIGHRRLAASKLAGLKTVPCVVAELTLEQQIATMLAENMQRSDLSVYEQAQGFQMMLNMGETVASVAEKTGFSQSTVRRRVKLLELDQEEFKKSCERGASLQDYIELDKIQDPELKNKVLEAVGTNNFKAKLSSALETEKARAWIEECLKVITAFAEEATADEGESLYQKYEYVKNYNQWNKSKGMPTVPEDAGEVQYYYHVCLDGKEVDLYKEREVGIPDEEVAAAERERKAEEERCASISDEIRRAYELRKEFVLGVSNSTAKQHLSEIVALTARNLIESYASITDEFFEFMEIPINDDSVSEDEQFLMMKEKIKRAPERAALLVAYAAQNDNSREGYSSWDGRPINNEELDELYNLLCSLGYEMSDDEKQLQDGTHPLFKKDGGQNDDEA